MKAILEFELPDDQFEHLAAVKLYPFRYIVSRWRNEKR